MSGPGRSPPRLGSGGRCPTTGTWCCSAAGSVLGWLSSPLAVIGRRRASLVRAKRQESKADALATELW